MRPYFMCYGKLLFFKVLFIYFERERRRDIRRGGGAQRESESESESESERERERIPSRLQAISSEPNAGLEPLN